MSKEKILIVEDERIVAEEIRYILSSMGYTVTGVVSTGADAIRAAGESLPDLVLMDIRLKGDMDGVEAAGTILKRYGIPAIYLTAFSDEATIQRAKLTRPLGYIIKPLDRIQVNSVIEVALYRYRREKTLIESEQWLSATLKTIDNGIIATANSGEIRYMNPAACMLAGVSTFGANGKPVDDIVSIIDIHTHEKLSGFFLKNISTMPSGPIKGSVILVSGDGYEIPVNYVISPVRDENKQDPGFIVILHDISGRLKIENVLQDSARKHRSLIEAAGEGIISLDAGHSILFANQTIADMLGYPRDHMVGQPVTRFLHTDCAGEFIAALQGDGDRSVRVCEAGLKKSDGSNAWVRIAINKMTDKDGNYTGALAMVSDVTGRKAMEIRLIEARVNTRLYLELIEQEIGKMNQIVQGYLDTSDELTE
jgi:PAS domain S-box-containing protein